MSINESGDSGNSGYYRKTVRQKIKSIHMDYSRDYGDPPRRPNMRGMGTDQDKATEEEVQ